MRKLLGWFLLALPYFLLFSVGTFFVGLWGIMYILTIAILGLALIVAWIELING